MSFIKQIARKHKIEAINNTTQPGYYLVKNDERYFVSEHINETALNRVCNKVLSDRVGWDYWVDYLHGFDVHGARHWSNVDQSDRFLDCEA